MIKDFSKLITGLSVILLLGSCAETSSDQLVVYSGRSQALVDPLVADFKEQTDIDIEVRYGNDAELLAVMSEEGDQSPADIYWANTTGALANGSEQDLLKALPDSLLNKPDGFTSSSDQWVPVTVRYRVLAYNPEEVDSTDLPSSVMDVAGLEQFEGRIGWTPTYSSFYDFMTTMRLREGEDVAREWLSDIQELNSKSYSSNTPMVQAIMGGEIDIALTNHYYILRMKYGDGEEESDTESSIETYHFENGDVGNLALITGAAELKNSENSEAAQQFLGFLLSREAQEYAAQSVHEYPVIRGISLPGYMLQEEKAFELSPDYDYEQLQQLEGTLNLLREAGII